MKDPQKPKKLIVNFDDPPEDGVATEKLSPKSNSGSGNKEIIDIDISDLDSDQKVIITGASVNPTAADKTTSNCPRCGFAIGANQSSSFVNKRSSGFRNSVTNKVDHSQNTRHRSLVLPAIILIPLIAFGLYFIISYLSRGSLITVPNDYPTIQQAIDVAENGSEIVVLPGTYNEIINFNGKEIIVRSEDPEEPETVATTIIDGRELGSVVSFNSSENSKAIFKGFTITGGSGTTFNIEHHEDGETLQTQGILGGGILIINNSSPTIENNYIIGNNVEGYGGGIAVWLGSSPEITDNIITGNIALVGGGIAVGEGSNPKVEGNDVNFNKSIYSGAGLAVSGFDSNPLIKDNLIMDNISDGEGGGVAVTAGATPLLDNNQFVSNMALRSLGGGGIFVHQSDPIIKNNSFDKNVSGGEGGGIAIYSLSNPFLYNNNFNANMAFVGGAIWLSEDSMLELKEPDDNEYIENMPDEIHRQ